jgi:ferredoxin-NADP reductase
MVAVEDVIASLPHVQLDLVYNKPLRDGKEDGDQQTQVRVDIVLLKNTVPHVKHQFYICTPTTMTESLGIGLSIWDVLSADICSGSSSM